MSFSLTGKTAIVTGAASGLGLAIARHFVDRGANVMFADSDEARLDAELGDSARSDGAIRRFTGDLTQKLALSNLVSATISSFDRIDILVNAHRKCLKSEVLTADGDQVEALWASNVLPALRLCQMVAKRMILSAEAARAAEEEQEVNRTTTPAQIGAIINLSAIAAQRLQPELLGFSMASAAVEQMTRTLALSLAPKGIRVNAVSVGSMMSAGLQSALKEAPDLRNRITEGTPMGRIAAPDEVAETVQYLASDAARFVTGQVVVVDGGRSLLDAVRMPAF